MALYAANTTAASTAGVSPSPSPSAAAWASAGMDQPSGGGGGGCMANYKIISTIGRGNFGVCHLCECIDEDRYDADDDEATRATAAQRTAPAQGEEACSDHSRTALTSRPRADVTQRQADDGALEWGHAISCPCRTAGSARNSRTSTYLLHAAAAAICAACVCSVHCMPASCSSSNKST